MPRVRTLLGGLFAILFALIIVAFIALGHIDRKAVYQQLGALIAENSAWQLDPEGSLSWSFIPLGIQFENVTATHRDYAHRAHLETALLELSWLPLLSGTVQTERLVITAPRIEWQLVTEPDAATPGTSPTTTSSPQEQTASTDSGLSLVLREVRLEDAEVRLLDASQQANWTISDLSLALNGWQDATPSPITSRFRLQGDVLPHSLDITASATLTTDLGQQDLALDNLSISLAHGNGEKNALFPLSIDGAASWKNETLRVPTLNIQNDYLKIGSTLESRFPPATQGKAQLQASVSGAHKLLALILDRENLPLKSLKLNASLGWDATQFIAKVHDLQMNDARFQLGLNAEGTPVQYALQVSGDNLDLRPWIRALNQTTQAAPGTSPSSDKALPAPTLPNMYAKVDLALNRLRLPRGEITDIAGRLHYSPEHVRLEQLSFAAAEGKFTFQADIEHAKSPWKSRLNGSAKDISLAALNDLVRPDALPVNGLATASFALTTQGTHTPELLQSLAGTGKISIRDGLLQGTNLQRLSCIAYAQFNRETLGVQEWPDFSSFEAIDGVLAIEERVLSIQSLILQSATLRGEGQGTIQINPAELSASLALFAHGAHPDPACRVNPRIARLPLPATCSGAWSPANIECKVDNGALLEATKDLAQDEAQRKVEKELDRALDKKLGDQTEAKEAIKSLLKGIFQ